MVKIAGLRGFGGRVCDDDALPECGPIAAGGARFAVAGCILEMEIDRAWSPVRNRPPRELAVVTQIAEDPLLIWTGGPAILMAAALKLLSNAD